MYQALLFDLDGTVYKGRQAILGAPAFFQKLHHHKIPYLFLTNRCNRLPETVSEHLNSLGIICTKNNVLTSAHTAATYFKSGKAYVIGEIGLTQILKDSSIQISEDNPDAVIVGFDESINYQKLEKATRFILNGARFIATNTDAIINTDHGYSPENGPIVAAIQVATGVGPEVVGKPQPYMIETAAQVLNLPKKNMIIIGDNPDTDILCGINADIDTALILTGVTNAEQASKKVDSRTKIIKDYLELDKFIFT